MTDLELMQRIKANYGAAIATATQASSVKPSLVAALVANESGGRSDAKRFEPAVLAALWEVLLGRKAAYGSIGAADLIQFVTRDAAAALRAAQSLPTDAFQRLDALATSWGLTQIMGYEVLDRTSTPGGRWLNSASGIDTFVAFAAPDASLPVTVKMLAQFAGRWELSLADDAAELLNCWNTGRPHAQTADPNYVPNGLARMKLYESLP
jgi:hypothetical protein